MTGYKEVKEGVMVTPIRVPGVSQWVPLMEIKPLEEYVSLEEDARPLETSGVQVTIQAWRTRGPGPRGLWSSRTWTKVHLGFLPYLFYVYVDLNSYTII